MTPSSAPLRAQAIELGIDVRFEDVDHVWHDADPDALRLVVEVLADDAAGSLAVEPVVVASRRPIDVAGDVIDAQLTLTDGTALALEVGGSAGASQLLLPRDLPYGCHGLVVETCVGHATTIATSTVVVAPPAMPRVAHLEGRSGLFSPAYALWDDDAPLPSFRLLGRLARMLPSLATDVVTTLPLYATFLDEPFDASPYAPASRLHWNEVYLDDEDLPPAPVPALGRYVDWRALAERRRAQLLAAAEQLDVAGRQRLDAFTSQRPDVKAFARFLGQSSGRTDALTARSHELAQLLADEQLAALARSARDAQGDAAGATLALDLPIGCHPEGYERWAHPALFAGSMTIGAPPDTFFTEGQDWGLPPQLPVAGRRSGHRLWRDLLERAGEHASLLRIDHVMAVHRLWWIPEGFEPHRGVYVRYPREELLAVIAATAATTGTTVVGEDLGTVPDEVEEALERWNMLGMYEELFHTDDTPLPAIPSRSVAGVRTHDMQPLAALVAGEGAALAPYRRRLGGAVGHPVADSFDAVLDAMLERLAASPASLVTVDLDDLLGVIEPHNVPGRVLETNWRRRLDRSLTATLADADVRRRLRLLGNRGDA